VAALDLERHLGAARRLPVDLLLLEDERLVLLGVDLDFEVVSLSPGARARDDRDGLAGGQLAIHAGRRDADALRSAAHAEPVELGAIEAVGENRRDLLPDDPGAVVGHGDPEAGRLAGRRRRSAVRDRLELHDDIGKDAGFLARVERVVDRLLDAREKRLARIVEPEKMPVLGEELGDGYLALASAHLDGGHRGARRRCRLRRRRGVRRTGLRSGLLLRPALHIPHTDTVVLAY